MEPILTLTATMGIMYLTGAIALCAINTPCIKNTDRL